MAGQRILVPSMGVRLPPSQPVAVLLMLTARSSSGSGRRPLKAEITGSNPVRATMSSRDTRTSLTYLARSSSGSGRRPLKAEITGSNPVRATNSSIPGFTPGIFLYRCSATGTLPHPAVHAKSRRIRLGIAQPDLSPDMVQRGGRTAPGRYTNVSTSVATTPMSARRLQRDQPTRASAKRTRAPCAPARPYPSARASARPG